MTAGILHFTVIHPTTQSSIARLWIALRCRSLSKGPLQGSFCLMVLTSSANQMELPLRLSSHCIFTNVCTFSAVTSMYFSFILTCLLLFFFYICFAFSDETWGKNRWWLLKWYRNKKKRQLAIHLCHSNPRWPCLCQSLPFFFMLYKKTHISVYL